MESILIFITAIFVNNVVLSQFLGICTFLGRQRGLGKQENEPDSHKAKLSYVLERDDIFTLRI